MSSRKCTTVFIASFIFIALSNMLSFGDAMKKADFLKKIESGFIDAVKVECAAIDSTSAASDLIPGYDYYMKIVEWIDRAVENGDYPVIEENSRTAESMQEISRSVFMANGFNSDAFILDFPPVKDKFASAYFPEKVGLEISYYIEKAKKLELILPGEEEKEIILQQIRELKENIGILVSGSFPSLPNDVIERQVNLYFIALERGPDSVITSSAKQSLSEKQMQEIYSGWDEILSHQTVPSIPEGDDQSPALKTQINQAISSYTRPLIKVIHSKFNENLPDQFKFFEKPERLRMLTQSFIHDLHAN